MSHRFFRMRAYSQDSTSWCWAGSSSKRSFTDLQIPLSVQKRSRLWHFSSSSLICYVGASMNTLRSISCSYLKHNSYGASSPLMAAGQVDIVHDSIFNISNRVFATRVCPLFFGFFSFVSLIHSDDVLKKAGKQNATFLLTHLLPPQFQIYWVIGMLQTKYFSPGSHHNIPDSLSMQMRSVGWLNYVFLLLKPFFSHRHSDSSNQALA